MSLSAYERETVITFSDEDSTCTIYTTSRPIITRCKKLGYEIIRRTKKNTGERIPTEE